MTEAPLVNLKMTEKIEEEAVKHSDGKSQAEDKVVESEARGHQQDEQESGPSVSGDAAKQESNIDEGDSLEQEKKAQEDGTPVQSGESDKPADEAENPIGDDKPMENTDNDQLNATDNADAESSENQKDLDEKKDIEIVETEVQAASKPTESESEKEIAAEMTNEKEKEEEIPTVEDAQDGSAVTIVQEGHQGNTDEMKDGTAGGEQQQEISTTTGEIQNDDEAISESHGDKQSESTSEEKAGEEPPFASDTQKMDENKQQKNGDEIADGTELQKSEESTEKEAVPVGDTSLMEQQGDSEPLQISQPENVVPSQEGQDNEAKVEEAEKPVELGVKETTEEEINNSTGEGAESIELPAKENNTLDNETQQSRSEQVGLVNTEQVDVQEPGVIQVCETTQQRDPVNGTGSVEVPVKTAAVETTAAGQQKPDVFQDENRKLKQEIFVLKQQEDAYRIKVLSLEQEVGKLRARKIDNRSQDSLASDSDSYLKQKLAETERELDAAERKVKDLQLRLKRFAKDDQIKDEKISQMEKEVKELTDHSKKLEQSIVESKREAAAMQQAGAQKNDSKVCVIL